MGAIWILSIVVLSISFTAIFNERKKEMAVLRVLGASKKMLREIILKEAVISVSYTHLTYTFLHNFSSSQMYIYLF